jgi:hypothetical protein
MHRPRESGVVWLQAKELVLTRRRRKEVRLTGA